MPEITLQRQYTADWKTDVSSYDILTTFILRQLISAYCSATASK